MKSKITDQLAVWEDTAFDRESELMNFLGLSEYDDLIEIWWSSTRFKILYLPETGSGMQFTGSYEISKWFRFLNYEQDDQIKRYPL